MPPLAAKPRKSFSSCGAEELPNNSPSATPIARITRAAADGRPDGSGGGEGGGPSTSGASFALWEVRYS